jgi:hypothetical protein
MRSFDVYTRPLRRSTDFSGPQTAVLFVVFALVASIPVITHPVPPLTDYVNHLARMHVIATIGNDPDLSRFYEIDWQIIPNLMMDLVIPRLVRFMSVYHAGQVFTVATFVLILSGTVAFNRALFGSWSVLPLVAFPLLYNHVFLVGVMNYMFGLGLALWALAAWVWLRERIWPLRLLVAYGARHLPGAQDRYNSISYDRYTFDWDKQFELSLDPETARSMHDETLPDAYYKEAAFCSMCGPKFCSMNYSAKVDEYNKQVHGVEKKDYSDLMNKLVAIK